MVCTFKPKFAHTVCTIKAFLYNFLLSFCNIATENNGEPVENLNKRDDAEAKTEPKAASKVGDEVDQCHPLRLLIL